MRKEVVSRLREHSQHTLMDASRQLLRDAADEIERLQKIIDDYARVCEASSREIAMLRARTPLDVARCGKKCADLPG